MRAEGEYINANELYGSVTDGSGGKVKGMSYNSSKARHAEINGVVKYDHWLTVLEAYNTEISAEGGYVEDLLEVTSYGTDYKGTIHQMKESGDITFSKNYISENTSTTSTVSHDITITQVKTGKSITVTLTQAKAEEEVVVTGYSYGVPTPTSSSIGSTTAKGTGSSPLYLTVWWTQKKYTNYSDGTSTSETISGSSRATIVSGSANNSSGAYISSGGVIVPSAGTTYYTSQRTVYTISRISFTANNVSSGNVSWTDYVSQSANVKESTGTSYELSFTSSDYSVEATSGSIVLSVTPYITTTYEWSSGVDGGSEKAVATTASVTLQRISGNGTLSRTSITGQGTAIYTLYSNSDESEIEHIIKASIGSSVFQTVTITQAAGSYEFYFEGVGLVSYGGGDYTIVLVSRLNGEFVKVVEDSVSIVGATIKSIVANESDKEYNINVTFPSNSESSDKTYTITAQQYGTGRTTSLEVTQEKKPASSVVTGSVSISNLVNSLYISGGYLYGFNSYPIFKIVPSNGYLTCRYALKLDFEINTSNGNTYYAEYEHTMDYITLNSVGSTTSVQFVNFPTYFDMQELTGYMFDPYSDNIEQIVIRASLVWKDGSGILSLGSIDDNTWYVYN